MFCLQAIQSCTHDDIEIRHFENHVRYATTPCIFSDSDVFQAGITINFLSNYLEHVHYEPNINTDLSISRIHGYLEPTATVKLMVNNGSTSPSFSYAVVLWKRAAAVPVSRRRVVSIFHHQLADNACNQLHICLPDVCCHIMWKYGSVLFKICFKIQAIVSAGSARRHVCLLHPDMKTRAASSINRSPIYFPAQMMTLSNQICRNTLSGPPISCL